MSTTTPADTRAPASVATRFAVRGCDTSAAKALFPFSATMAGHRENGKEEDAVVVDVLVASSPRRPPMDPLAHLAEGAGRDLGARGQHPTLATGDAPHAVPRRGRSIAIAPPWCLVPAIGLIRCSRLFRRGKRGSS